MTYLLYKIGQRQGQELPLCHPPPLCSPQQTTTNPIKNAPSPCLSVLPPSSFIYILFTRVHCAHHTNDSNFLESFGVGRYITDEDVTLLSSTNLFHIDAVNILLHRSILPSRSVRSPYLERSPSECLISIVEDPINFATQSHLYSPHIRRTTT